jgi:hypothetical protein
VSGSFKPLEGVQYAPIYTTSLWWLSVEDGEIGSSSTRKNSKLTCSREALSNASAYVHSNGPAYRLEWVRDDGP